MKRTNIDAEIKNGSKFAYRRHHRVDEASAIALSFVSTHCAFCIRSFLIALFGIVLTFPAAAGQTRQSLTGFYHTSWTAKDGLPGSVLSLAQTTDGFLWIGGRDGLFRFDGIVMERYTPPHGMLLHEERQSALRATSNGGLWIGYGEGGISFLKDGKITSFGEGDGFPAGLVRTIATDGDGVVWAAVVGGLARFDGNHWEKIQMGWNYPGTTAFSIVIDQEGTVWVTSENAVFFLPRGKKHFQDAGLSTRSGVLLLAPDNLFWLTEPHSNSIVQLQIQSGKLSRSQTLIQATDWTPIFDHNGGLWIGSWGDGILHIPSPSMLPKGTTSKLSSGAETFTEADGLSDNRATSWLEDREGNIWIATNAGLDRLRRSGVSWSALQPGTHPFSLIPSADGNIIAASSFGGMVQAPQGTPVVDAPKNVLLTYRAPNGVVWLNCDDGSGTKFTGSLFEWKDRHFTKVAAPPDVEHIQVTAMTMDSSGTLWVSFISNGVYRFRDGVWTHVDVIKTDPRMSARSTITDSKDSIWLAFPKHKSVVRMTGSDIVQFSTDKDIPVGPVYLLSQSGGSVWAAGSQGIAFSVNDKFHPVVASDGSKFAGAFALVATDSHGVWLTARQGIFHIPQTEVEQAVRDPSYRVKYELFDQRSDLSDPLQTENEGVVGAAPGTDGALWFATRNGVARIDPRNIARDLLAPPVSIRSLSVDGKEYGSTSIPSLPAFAKDLRIDYTALSLTVPERVRFRYRLDGWESDWVDAGTRRQAFYTNLNHGTYRFHVIACNSDGVWNDLGATLEFSIVPAWYQTAWFFSLCVIAIVLLLWAFYNLRLRQVRGALNAKFNERLAERTRIAQDLHDTFLQTIQGSKLVADDALDNSTDPAQMRRAMEKISGWMAQATEEERAVLNALRNSTTETNDLAAALRRATEDCSLPHSMTLDFRVVGVPSAMHPIIRDEIYRIGFEAIRNASVHSSASKLEIELTYGRNLTLRVADNGVGIDPSIAGQGKEGHFGLPGMHERAERIGARLTVSSEVGQGTEIKLVVPGSVIFQAQAETRHSLVGRLLSVTRGTNQKTTLD